MRFNTRLAFGIGCLCLLALSVPAHGSPADKKDKAHAAVQKPRALRQAQKGQPVLRRAGADRLVSFPVREPLKRPASGWPALVAEARKYMGTNPTARKKLWCATFMNMVLRKTGYAGTNSDAARSFAYYGHRISSPRIGAIAVLTRGKTGGHVGVVTGIDPHGNPIIISGNHGHRVGEGIYPSSRVIAYVMPTESRPLTQVADRSSPAPRTVASSGPDIDSPITELIAAIEAEQTRSDNARPQAPQPPPQQQQARQAQPEAPRAGDMPRAGETPRANDTQPQRLAEPETPHRLVQQTPEQTDANRGAVDPTVADMFGLKDREAVPVPPRPVPQRSPRPRGRVAAADIYVNLR
jgi:uncharacterized protein (TIGR02594 family)